MAKSFFKKERKNSVWRFVNQLNVAHVNENSLFIHCLQLQKQIAMLNVCTNQIKLNNQLSDQREKSNVNKLTLTLLKDLQTTREQKHEGKQ